ncbi:MAG: NTP transferase domain-containing protein, partial [Gammaproteobacteria bacterium]|nr:NTP transferase domain-containing protein [Gammaproteobacteria bacterium]
MSKKPALVVLAAGMASRYGSPKQLDAVGPHGEGIIDYSVFDAARAGFGKVVFVIKEQSADSFDAAFMQLRQNIDVEYAFQDRLPPPRQKPWGTGHALLSAADKVSEPFAMINADDYYGQSAFVSAAKFLADRKSNSLEFGMLGYALRDTLSPHGSVSRGLCNADEQGKLVSIVEHTKIVSEKGDIVSLHDDGSSIQLTGSEPTSMNFWLLTPAIFSHLRGGLERFLESFGDSEKEEFVLPNFIGELIDQQIASVAVLGHSDT